MGIQTLSLDQLTVLHRLRASTQFSSPAPNGAALRVETCMRTLLIYLSGSTAPLLAAESAWHRLEGVNAYHFLLRVACGLESEVLGETEIFGQIKAAWAERLRDAGPDGQALHPLVRKLFQQLFQHLFEDTKEIRSRFFQDAGATTYGALVRKILRGLVAENEPDRASPHGPVLLVGGGQLATSIAPFLNDRAAGGTELWICNRTHERAEAIAAALASGPHGGTRTSRITPWADICVALAEARHVVVCVPSIPSRDREWVEAFLSPGHPSGRKLIHLGVERANAQDWLRVPGLTTLDEFFALQRANDASRRAKGERAARACLEKSLLRSLGGPTSLAHGWEDLALFC